ncbi:MAG: hypothetical protein GX033_06975 [Firmicutes bacterium]|nr:hypothetical protein [Bacillota bacterium]
MKKGLLILGVVSLLTIGLMRGTSVVKAATYGHGWLNVMHSRGMRDAMRSGDMWEYMNQPQIKEQLEDTPRGEMMYSQEMEEFMTSDAFRKFTTSPKVQEWMHRGAGHCHGAWNQAPADK